MPEQLGRKFIVTYPVLDQVGGVLVDEDGNRLGVQQAALAGEVVEKLAELIDPAEIAAGKVLVVPGWEKAPDGLRARYEERRAASGSTRTLSRVDEDQIAAARATLNLP